MASSSALQVWRLASKVKTRQFYPFLTNVIQRRHYHVSKDGIAIKFSEFGDPREVLSRTSYEIPKLKNSDVLIKMIMAPINPSDINTIEGTYHIRPKLPAIPGNEGVGVVVDRGSAVKNLEIGSWVLPDTTVWGTWRTYAVVDEATVQNIDNDIPALSAATIKVNPCTAYRMLKDYVHLHSGDVVIQNGANSAVGQCVVQLAREWGLQTVNVIRDRPDSQQVIDHLTGLGATHVVTETFFKSREMKELMSRFSSPPKLALNCVGGKSSTELIRHLSAGGVMVTYGGMSKQPVIVPTGAMIFKEIKLAGYWNTEWDNKNKMNPEKVKMYDELCDLIRDCKLLPPVSDLIPIEHFKEAVSSAMEGFKGKKKVLVLNDDVF